jgi:putative transposase
MRRTNVVKLAVDEETHEKELGIITAKCWNEVNWLRMQQFKKEERVDFARTEKEPFRAGRRSEKDALSTNTELLTSEVGSFRRLPVQKPRPL